MRIKILLLEVDMIYFRFCKEHKLREQKQQWDLIKHPLFPNFLLNLKISTYIDINKLINILYFSHKNCVITCRICKSTEQRKNQVPLHSVFQTPCHLINGEISALSIYLSTNIYYSPYFSDYKMHWTIRHIQVLEEENRRKKSLSTAAPPPQQARQATVEL